MKRQTTRLLILAVAIVFITLAHYVTASESGSLHNLSITGATTCPTSSPTGRIVRCTGKNQTRAAKFLGLTRDTLVYRMQKFGLSRENV